MWNQRSWVVGAALAIGVSVPGALALAAEPGARVPAAAEPSAAERHVAEAKTAAGTQWDGLFNVLCAAPAPPAPAPNPPAAPPAKPPGPPDRATWYAPPQKVFDNLYFVGMTEYSAWAVTTSEGIILIDTLYDYSVEAEVVDGLRQLGLDPKKIVYAIISHGHADHSGGARLLQERFGTKVIAGAEDWDLMERSPGTHPKRDIVASDRMEVSLGDTTLKLHLTPGHTLGTLSAVIPLKDRGRPHVAVTWGGTAFNWLKNRDGYITPDRSDAFWFRNYYSSAQSFARTAANAHADVLLSNHTIFDGSKTKLPLVRSRGADQPNPYVVGEASVMAYLKVAETCARAGLARLPSGASAGPGSGSKSSGEVRAARTPRSN
jgi:metallo-beta-lactamase class B